jgi:uncharacterized protein YggE
MKIKKIMIVAVVFISTLTNAQTVIDSPYIEVNGKSEMVVMPDQIIVSIVLKEKEKGKKVTSTDQQLQALKTELGKLNIPLSKLSLTHSNADYIRVKFRKKDLVNKANYNLILENAKEVNEVFEMLDVIDVYQANITEVTHSKIIEFKKEIRISATKAAKEKADYLLKELDAKRGLPLVVREEHSNSSYRSNNYLSNNISFGPPQVSHSKISSKGGEIGFRKIKITAQVYVKFLIKEKG